MNFRLQIGKIRRIKPEAGLTLVELLIAMAIAVFMGFVIFELLSGAMGDWNRTQVNSNVTADANIVLSRLGREIRLARNPNQHTKAVVVVVETKDNGDEETNHRLDIYHYDQSADIYQRICYLVEEISQDGQTIYRLKRGVVETTDPGNDENPQYGTISNWQILLDGINSKSIFYDNTGNTSSDRRLIEVSLSMSDKDNNPPQYTNYQIKTSFMSRSQRLNSLTGEGGGSEIAVTGISVSSTTTTISRNGGTFNATAQVTPNNASNQKVSWSANKNWITIDDPGKTTILVTVPANDSRWPQYITLTATSEDGGYTDSVTVTQNGYW